LTSQCQSCGEIQGGGGFSHTTFLIGDCDDFHALFINIQTGKLFRETAPLAIKTAGWTKINAAERIQRARPACKSSRPTPLAPPHQPNFELVPSFVRQLRWNQIEEIPEARGRDDVEAGNRTFFDLNTSSCNSQNPLDE
jgi:hypothetical protein